MHIPSYTSYPGPDTGLSTLTFLEGPVIQGGPGPPQKKRGKKKKKKKRGLDFSGVGGPAFSVSGPGHINMNRICFPAKQ